MVMKKAKWLNAIKIAGNSNLHKQHGKVRFEVLTAV
jgi:hypothetical protein